MKSEAGVREEETRHQALSLPASSSLARVLLNLQRVGLLTEVSEHSVWGGGTDWCVGGLSPGSGRGQGLRN